MDFIAFPKIEKFAALKMSITQKIHGSNALVCISPDGELKTGSRTRWVTPEDDNYGFSNFVNAHREEFITLLGPGYHYGEWAGPGINSGEGLSVKTFVLFDWWKYPAERKLPLNVRPVPVLYNGAADVSAVHLAMDKLLTEGSLLSPGFMRPEGVVVQLNKTRYKVVFKPEETSWTKGVVPKGPRPVVDYSYLAQPARLEKLLLQDERYLTNYPSSLGDIMRAYVKDLEDEGQFRSKDPDELEREKKGCTKFLFSFVKQQFDERSLAACPLP